MRSYLHHAVWLVIAVAAFALGKHQFSAANDGQSSNRNDRNSTSSQSELVRADRAASRNGPGSQRAPREISARGTNLSATQMQEAVAEVLSITNPIERQKQFGELLESLTAENAEAAVQALRDAPRSRWSRGQEYSLLTYAWGRLDGPAAVAYANGLEGRTKEWTMAAMLSGWASENPGEARTWVENIEDPSERSQATRGLISGLAQRDVNAAIDYVFQLEKSGAPGTSEYMDTIVRQQLTQGITLAVDWTDQLPDGALKGTAMERVASEYVRQDPALAAKWAAQYAENDYAKDAIGEISEEWAEDDPSAALTWAESLAEGDSRNRAVYEAVSEWADQAPLEAGDYVIALPPGAQRDSAASAYARRIADEDPTVAVDWALSIADEDLRNQTTSNTIREWMRQDPASASTWLQEVELPESVVTEINRPPDRRWRR